MKKLSLFTATLIFSAVMGASAQTSWLDRPMGRNWNAGDGAVPQAPQDLVPIDARCRNQIRTPDSLADRAVTRAGWSLFGAAQSFGTTTVVNGMGTTDGMCRPTQYNTFVFVNNQFAGTLSPTTMNSRTDGALTDAKLISGNNITAEFMRYRASDAMCCPSQKSTVIYKISVGGRLIVEAKTVNSAATCAGDGDVSTEDNVVSGTITYRQRVALPANAVISVRLIDVSRADTAASVIAEDRIDAGGKQVPISFDLAYERSKIQERTRYVIRAEIRDGDRLLYTTDMSYPVITLGNPRSVEVVVVPVGGGGGGGNRQNVIRGTVTYRQRIALAPNSEARIWLVDSGDPTGKPVAETTVPFGNRQVPLAFELPFEMRDINRQRSYELQAEIRSDGKLRFRTERGVPVTLRGGAVEDIELLVIAANEGPVPITGQELSLSKIGVGNIQVGRRTSVILFRAAVAVRANGDAYVTLSWSNGSTMFGGKLVGFDAGTLRIAVQNSGNASAAGEIEVSYSGRSISSITARDLVLDGQNVAIRF